MLLLSLLLAPALGGALAAINLGPRGPPKLACLGGSICLAVFCAKSIEPYPSPRRSPREGHGNPPALDAAVAEMGPHGGMEGGARREGTLKNLSFQAWGYYPHFRVAMTKSRFDYENNRPPLLPSPLLSVSFPSFFLRNCPILDCWQFLFTFCPSRRGNELTSAPYRPSPSSPCWRPAHRS
jgi:hypothetical protein